MAETCKNPSLDGLWIYGVTVSWWRIYHDYRNKYALGLWPPLSKNDVSSSSAPRPGSILRGPAREACPCAHTNTRVDRAHRLCLSCGSAAVGDERHLVFECAALASLRPQHFIDIGSVSVTE